MRWQDSVHADTVEPFLVPEFPRTGDEILVRMRVRRDAPVAAATVRAILDGVDRHFDMHRVITDEWFQWYETRFVLRQPRTNYSFLVRDSSGHTWYFNRSGTAPVYRNHDSDFTINAEYQPPRWVRRTVFYQIYPDRYFKSGLTAPVEDGEISRGRFTSRRMAWNDVPLAYHDGGSLDFFGGDLPGIESKLDYLEELGVSALYLTPVFAAKTNHRYDCLDYFTVDPHLGGNAALISLVAAAHRRDIRVVLDVSINHIGEEHDWAQGIPGSDGLRQNALATDESGRIVRWAGVPELLKLDYGSAAVRRRMYEDSDSVVQRYLREPYGIDGWRFDVASETGRSGGEQFGDTVWRNAGSAMRSIKSDVYIVGELWQDAHHYLQGDMWDSAMNYFASGRPLRMWVGEQDRFAVHPVQEAVPGRRISGTELRELIEQHFNRIPSGAVHCQFNILDSHDTTRLHNNTSVFDWNVYAGTIMLLFLLPGTVSVYYGDEVGLPGSLDGDHGKRYPMEWNRREWDARFVELYGKLIGLKRTSAALHSGSHRVLDAGDEHLIYARFTTREYLVLVLNRCPEAQTMRVDLSVIGPATVETLVPAAQIAAPVLDGAVVTVAVDAHCSVLLGGSAVDSGPKEVTQ